MSTNDDSASAPHRIASALELLASDQWVITPIPGMVTATRRWYDQSRDTVVVLHPDSAHARRDDHARNLVWQTNGTAEAGLWRVKVSRPQRSPGAPAGRAPGAAALACHPVGPV